MIILKAIFSFMFFLYNATMCFLQFILTWVCVTVAIQFHAEGPIALEVIMWLSALSCFKAVGDNLYIYWQEV